MEVVVLSTACRCQYHPTFPSAIGFATQRGLAVTSAPEPSGELDEDWGWVVQAEEPVAPLGIESRPINTPSEIMNMN